MDISEIAASFRSAADRAGFILDFDGTLAPIVPVPEQAHPLPGASDLLRDLASRYRLVAVLTGRRAEDAASRLQMGGDGVRILGLYGVEEVRAGELRQHPKAERWRSSASRLARDAQAFLSTRGLAGTQVEYKDLTVSVHYRNEPDPSAASVIAEWAEAFAPRKGFLVHDGRMVVELRPPEMSKAAAVEGLIDESRLELACMAGDDSSDAHAMSRARRLLGGGLFTIGVVSEEGPSALTDSDLVVNSAMQVIDILRQF